MAKYLEPGIYTDETIDHSLNLKSVNMTVAGFLGVTKRGPSKGRPVLLTSLLNFQQIFGSHLDDTNANCYLSYAVEQFFSNGGQSCYVMRIVNKVDETAFAELRDEAIASITLRLEATSVGSWGNDCTITVEEELSTELGAIIKIEFDGNQEEFLISFQPSSSIYIEKELEKSQFVHAQLQHVEQTEDIEDWYNACIHKEPTNFVLCGGNSNPVDATCYIGVDGGIDNCTGMEAYKYIEDVSTMVIPGVCLVEVQQALIAHCEMMRNRFAVLDMPYNITTAEEMIAYRAQFDTSYGAIYHPWIQCLDQYHMCNCYFPPSGAVAGIYARVAINRGVHKAPANENVFECTGLSFSFDEELQGKVNPKGVNLIRDFPRLGVRIWGARTMSNDTDFKYVNVRRLLIYLEEMIHFQNAWAVNEPNDAILWNRVQSSTQMFLNSMWRNGALVGSCEEEAFFIHIGKSTMTDDDILNGRLIYEVGVAPTRPAEFIIYRFTHQRKETE